MSKRHHRGSRSAHNKHVKIGCGGMRCNCCFPAPGSKARRLEFRAAKRREAKQAFRDWQNNPETQDDLLNEYFREITETDWFDDSEWFDIMDTTSEDITHDFYESRYEPDDEPDDYCGLYC